MPDQSDEYRKAAAQCIRLARTTTDPGTRAILLLMAQGWYDRANGPTINFDSAQNAFNDAQMTPRPIAQQQQQVQPRDDDDGIC